MCVSSGASDFAWWGISLCVMIQGSHVFHSDTQQLVSDHRTMWLTHSPTMCRRHMTNFIRWPFPSFCNDAFEWRSHIKTADQEKASVSPVRADGLGS